MNSMTIINDADSLKEVWTVQTFKERYSGKYSSQALVVNDQNPEKGLVTIRAHIEDSAELQKNGSQKFVIAIRFYSFGDMATVDVVSLPLNITETFLQDIFKMLAGVSIPTILVLRTEITTPHLFVWVDTCRLMMDC